MPMPTWAITALKKQKKENAKEKVGLTVEKGGEKDIYIGLLPKNAA
jgi:hypothetical protein